MFKKINTLIFFVLLMIFMVCSKDKGLYENTKTTDPVIEVEKDIKTGNQTNDFTDQVSKLRKLTQLAAKEWNHDVAANLYKYFSKTKQYGIELSAIRTKLEQEAYKQDNIIQLFSEFTDVHLEANECSHPIEIYIPKDPFS